MESIVSASSDATSAPQSSNRKRKTEENDSSIIPSKKIRFSVPYRRQNWSLPDSIVFYIAKNPSSPGLYEKTTQSCKYFYAKNPIAVIPCLYLGYENNKWRACIYGFETKEDMKKRIDLSNVTAKLWILYEICIENLFENRDDQSFVSSIMDKIYQCDIRRFDMYKHNIYFDDFKFFGSKCKEIWLDDVTVKNKDGSVVALEEIVEVLSKVKDFRYFMDNTPPNIVTSKSVEKLIKIPHFSNIVDFTLSFAPEVLDIETFYIYMKKNKTTRIDLHFCDKISEAYESRLQDIVYEILDADTYDFKVPMLEFSGMDQLAHEILSSLFVPY
uniref:Uncharacterized protein n=1 Tax=Panagrolaimus sp. ES5 TaxID=591445 RepID=A0AC34FQ94_9BILA